MRQFFVFIFSLYIFFLVSGCGKPLSIDVLPPTRPLVENIATRGKKTPTFTSPKGILTLSKALTLAIRYGPNLPVAEWEIRTETAKIKQASQRPNPELETELEKLDEIETTVQLRFPIELGRKRLRRQNLAQLSAALSGWEYESLRLDTLTATTLAFIDVWQNQSLVAINQELVGLSRQIYNTVKKQIELGVKAGIEQVPAQIEWANSRLVQQQSQKRLIVSRQALAATWGQAIDTFDRVEEQLELILPVPPIDKLSEQILAPELARWQTEIELQKAIVELEKSNRYPELTVGGGIKYISPPNGGSNLGAVGSLSLPLPVLNQNRGSILVAKSNLQKTHAEQVKAKVYIGNRLAQAYQTLVSAQNTIRKLKDEILPISQDVFKAIKIGQKLGKFTFLELTNAQSTLFEVKRSYINTLAEYHRAVAQIERLIGQPLSNLVQGE